MDLAGLIETAALTRSTSWWRYAVARTGRVEDADDVVQDAVYRTLRAQPDLKTVEEVSRYIWTVLSKTSVFAVRQFWRGDSDLLDENDVRAAQQQFARSPLEILLDTEAKEEQMRTFELALAALEDLPEQNREAIELHVLQEPPLVLREIAALQNVAISTVHGRIESGLEEVEIALRQSQDGG